MNHVRPLPAVPDSIGVQAQMKEMPGGLWEIHRKMDMTMNSPRGSMKMQTEGKRIAVTREKQ